MKRGDDGDSFVLSTGKSFYANRCILGLDEKSDGRVVMSEGYDGHVQDDEFGHLQGIAGFDTPAFTQAERDEISNYMASSWKLWASQPPPKR